MSIWSRIGSLLHAVAESGANLVDRILTAVVGDAAHRRAVAFSIAVVALAAKMARADGVVTADEVAAFRTYFHVPEEEEPHVRRLFRLAQGDVAGYEHYAARIADLFADEPALKEDVLEGLFMIAAADGLIHEDELAFLEHVSEIFGVQPGAYGRIRARHVRPGVDDPYIILGIERTASDAALRSHYLNLVRELHPDRFVARGVPPEFVKIANDRLATINAAFAAIERERVS